MPGKNVLPNLLFSFLSQKDVSVGGSYVEAESLTDRRFDKEVRMKTPGCRMNPNE